MAKSPQNYSRCKKPKLAVYWASSCGGCEVAILNLDEHFLELGERFEFVFCPCLLDTKTSAVEALSDQAIDLTLFNGDIRNDENLAMALLLRQKSRLLVAFGSCAAERNCFGGLWRKWSDANVSGAPSDRCAIRPIGSYFN